MERDERQKLVNTLCQMEKELNEIDFLQSWHVKKFHALEIQRSELSHMIERIKRKLEMQKDEH